jgi:hypothetical protein
VIALAWLLGCLPDPSFVTLSGTVFSDAGEDAEPVAGAELHSLARTAEEVDRTTADDSGYFEIQIPSGDAFFIGVEGEGYVPTGFSGQSASSDYAVTDGLIWMHSGGAMDVIQSEFEGCEENDADGGVIEGWVGLGLDTGQGLEAFQVTTAWVTAYDAEATAYETCYLSDDPELVLYDPEAELTGHHGRFLVQGSPTGLSTLEVGYWIDQASDWSIDPLLYVIYVPEGGVAPFRPLWVPAAE